MDFKKGLEMGNKICMNHSCEKCPIEKVLTEESGCPFAEFEFESVENIVIALEQYEKEHRHTYRKEFLKRFPHTEVSAGDLHYHYCLNFLFGQTVTCKGFHVEKDDFCRACWNQEYKEG